MRQGPEPGRSSGYTGRLVMISSAVGLLGRKGRIHGVGAAHRIQWGRTETTPDWATQRRNRNGDHRKANHGMDNAG